MKHKTLHNRSDVNTSAKRSRKTIVTNSKPRKTNKKHEDF